MKLLALEAVQNGEYYLSRYQRLVELGADLCVLNGLGEPGYWPAERYRIAGSKHIDDLITAAKGWHAEQQFEGVLSFSESAVLAVAAVAEALGLPGIGVEAARTSRNKLLMRQAHQRAGVPHPRFRFVPDLAAALAAAADFGYPVILKPTLGGASNFVFRVDSPAALTERFGQAREGIERMGWYRMESDGLDLGPHGLLVESFLEGPEFLTEALIWDDEVYLGSVVDRVTIEGDTFDDDVHRAPTALAPDQLAAVHRVIADAARAQGLRRSVMHAEVRFHQGEPHLLEIAARPGGGGLDYFAMVTAGYSPLRVLMDVVRGVRPEVGHYRPTGVHAAGFCLIGPAGEVEQITVPASVPESDRVFFFKLTAKPGDVIRRPPDGNNILGFLCTTGDSFADAMAAAQELAGRIDVRMRDRSGDPDQVTHHHSEEQGMESSTVVTAQPPAEQVPAGQAAAAPAAPAAQPVRGGSASWACHPGFPPSTIFPFTPPERIGIRNLFEFQVLMYRPLYWLGRNGTLEVDYDLSLAEPPEWDADGRTVTVTLKPWKWSNGETVCADNVMFWVNMMVVKGARCGTYVPGFFPDNLTSYEKVAPDKVRFVFDRAYSRSWIVMNQLSLITPMPKAWDRTADDTPANASTGLADIPAVYDYLVSQNGEWTSEDNSVRAGWPDSPVWSVVNGPWRLSAFSLDGEVTFVPNDQYSGPNKPYLAEFKQVPVASDEQQFATLQDGPDAPGAIQVGYLPYGMDVGLTAGGANPLQDNYRLVPQNVTSINYMPINYANTTGAGQILKEAYVRQALQSCLDQDSIIRDVFHGYAYRTDGPIALVGSDPTTRPPARWPFDVQAARQLLTDNGWDVSSTPAVCVRPGSGPGCAGEGIAAGTELSFTDPLRGRQGGADHAAASAQARRRQGRHRAAAAGRLRLGDGRRGPHARPTPAPVGAELLERRMGVHTERRPVS